MKIAIAIPAYQPGSIGAIALMSMFEDRGKGHQVHLRENAQSLLTANFNTLWAWALNLRDKGLIDLFLMMHADIKPRGQGWLDRMVNEMETAEADVLSAIVPIKSPDGLTSTAFDTDFWRPVRLTVKQAADLPVTWTVEGLLLFNTGLMLVDFRREWVTKVCFTINDRIAKGSDGWYSSVEPEDWNFSRQCVRMGLRCFVTRAVPVDHYGTSWFSSDSQWGNEHDLVNPAEGTVEIISAVGDRGVLTLDEDGGRKAA